MRMVKEIKVALKKSSCYINLNEIPERKSR